MDQYQSKYDLIIFKIIGDEIKNPNFEKEIIKFNRDKLKTAFLITGIQIHVSYKLSENIISQIFRTLQNGNLEGTLNTDKNIQELQGIKLANSKFNEILYEQLIKKDYIKQKEKSFQSYLDSFYIAFNIIDKKTPLVIMLGGTSGTGKSTVSSILATRFGIPTCLSSDSIRHILRNFLSLESNPVLFASTYQAYKQITWDPSLNLSEQSKIIKGYKQQCQLVQDSLEQIIENYIKNNESIVIEGVHLTPDFMLKMMKKYKVVIPFALYIPNEIKHKQRFAVRSKYMTIDSRYNKYCSHFNEIRLIQKWFLEKADQYLIPKITNMNIDKSVNIIHRIIIYYVKAIQKNQINFNEIQNALGLYEISNKIQKNILSADAIKEYINQKVNKQSREQQLLSQISADNSQNNHQQIHMTLPKLQYTPVSTFQQAIVQDPKMQSNHDLYHQNKKEESYLSQEEQLLTQNHQLKSVKSISDEEKTNIKSKVQQVRQEKASIQHLYLVKKNYKENKEIQETFDKICQILQSQDYVNIPKSTTSHQMKQYKKMLNQKNIKVKFGRIEESIIQITKLNQLTEDDQETSSIDNLDNIEDMKSGSQETGMFYSHQNTLNFSEKYSEKYSEHDSLRIQEEYHNQTSVQSVESNEEQFLANDEEGDENSVEEEPSSEEETKKNIIVDEVDGETSNFNQSKHANDSKNNPHNQEQSRQKGNNNVNNKYFGLVICRTCTK